MDAGDVLIFPMFTPHQTRTLTGWPPARPPLHRLASAIFSRCTLIGIRCCTWPGLAPQQCTGWDIDCPSPHLARSAVLPPSRHLTSSGWSPEATCGSLPAGAVALLRLGCVPRERLHRASDLTSCGACRQCQHVVPLQKPSPMVTTSRAARFRCARLASLAASASGERNKYYPH